MWEARMYGKEQGDQEGKRRGWEVDMNWGVDFPQKLWGIIIIYNI